MSYQMCSFLKAYEENLKVYLIPETDSQMENR